MTKIRAKLSTKNKYYISKHAFYTAYHFALQYPEWKDRYDELLSSSLRAIDYEKDNTGGSFEGDATARIGIKISAYKGNLDLINRIAVIAGDDLSAYILQAVTQEGVTYNYLRQRGMPCGKNEFYLRRRRFYYLLSKALGEKEIGHAGDNNRV